MNLATSVPTVPGVKVVESEGDESEEEESEILEESPCGRWLKRREEVAQLILCSESIQLLRFPIGMFLALTALIWQWTQKRV